MPIAKSTGRKLRGEKEKKNRERREVREERRKRLFRSSSTKTSTEKKK